MEFERSVEDATERLDGPKKLSWTPRLLKHEGAGRTRVPSLWHDAMRFSVLYACLAGALFLVEVAIALLFDDAFVRPYLGDVLVVPLVQFSVAALLPIRPRPLAVGAFAFACAVELAQYFRLVEVLGLQHLAVARTVLGTVASAGDVVAYAAGAALGWLVHARCERPAIA